MNEIDMIDNTKESIKWIKPIIGHERYLITNTGAIWSTIKKIWLKPIKEEGKHLQVHIDGEEPYIHRLVFETFVRPLNEGEVVHHINGIKTDNRLQNLKVMNHGEHTTTHNIGNLYNLNHHHSQQTKMKISKSNKGKIGTWKGKKLPPEMIAKRTATRMKNDPNYGKNKFPH